MPDDMLYRAAMAGYIYGYPMVVMDVTREVLTATATPAGRGAPINQLANAMNYVSADFKNVVRVSRDSLWSTAWLDLDSEPLVLSLPDTGGRYHVFSVLNMWTDVFGSIGKRTHGTGGGHFLIAGPKWCGDVPTGITETFRSSTRYAWLVGQTEADGEGDVAEVNALQAQYQLTPLAAWGHPSTPRAAAPVDPRVNTQVPPAAQVAAMGAGAFFERLTTAMGDNPPYDEDEPVLAALKSFGAEPGKPFDIAAIDPAVAAILEAGVRDARSRMADSGGAGSEGVNGWICLRNLGRFGTDYVTRAGIAKEGLGANLAEDTIYPMTFVDGDGAFLDGAHNYVMHYDKDGLPPTNATWSISLYQGPNYVPNAIDRYHLAPWMPLQYNSDGSLDIYLQAADPGPEKAANWLPTPAEGAFNLTIRNYWPTAEALDERHQNPPARRVPGGRR